MTFTSPLSRLLAMALLAVASLVPGRSIAQAPTGIGKTVGTLFPRTRWRTARQDRLGRPADHPPARMAHLLEEPGRLRSGHGAAVDPAARRDGRRHRVAIATQDPDRQPGQLRLRRHGLVAGAGHDRPQLPARPAGGRPGSAAARILAGLQTRVHPAGWRLRPQDPDPQFAGRPCCSLRRGPAGPAERPAGITRQQPDSGRQHAAAAHGQPACRAAWQDAGVFPRIAGGH